MYAFTVFSKGYTVDWSPSTTYEPSVILCSTGLPRMYVTSMDTAGFDPPAPAASKASVALLVTVGEALDTVPVKSVVIDVHPVYFRSAAGAVISAFPESAVPLSCMIIAGL